MQVNSETPHKIWGVNIEEKALEQFENCLNMPECVQGALMADAHTGYTACIGSVLAFKDIVSPSIVGFDIGCGVCAIQTSFKKEDVIEHGEAIHKAILERLPVGFNVHQEPQIQHSLLTPEDLTLKGQEVFELRKGFRQLGTLGGGNHWASLDYDANDRIWITVHSGSRGIGHGIATEYIKLAHPEGRCKDGEYSFQVDSESGQNYINDLNWCLEFALENRALIVKLVEEAIQSVDLDGHTIPLTLINRNHNHAEFKDGLWIHRKGATHAEEGMMGIIAGNMRDGSFIVKGKGNPDSLCSASHGAGRVMSRKKAKKTLDVNEFKKQLKDVVSSAGETTLDEAPGAYKDIFEVMELQKDLVTVVEHVKTLVNVKG